jgi:predicted CXXCH cytochrome family protein
MLNRKNSSVIFLAALHLVVVATAGAAEKTCIDCHKKVFSKRVVHAPLNQYVRMEQGCELCHTAPHAKKKGALSLAAPVPDLCFMCHDKAAFSKQNIHPPVAGGDCLTCHNPHSADAPRLLNQPVPFICQNCHPDKTSGKHILGGYGFGDNHPIQGRIDPSRKGQELGCASCHNPHSSQKKNLFVNDEAGSPENLCLLCHSKVAVRPTI